MTGVIMPEFLRNKLKHFTGGLKRSIAAEKRETGQNTDEGKEKMDFKVYSKIAELMFKQGGTDFIFAHCFLVIEWNLMARSDNVIYTHINHMKRIDDALVFYFKKSKGDQEGVNENEPWHVYANPSQPFICPILAMTRYVACNPQVLAGDCKIFESKNPYQRYIKAFRRILETNEAIFVAMGVDIDELGSHSVRKGSASRCSTGCTVSPPMASICLRAGWSMGPVKERYIHYEKAGDQFVGRTVCGLDVTSEEFGVTTCHFDFTAIEEEEERVQVKAEIEKTIRDYFGSGNELPPAVYIMCYYFFATLSYHYTFLQATLESTDRLRQSTIFQAVTEKHIHH